MYINFLKVLTLKIFLIHKITIFAIYTPWETLEKFRFTLPHFPLLICISPINYTLYVLVDLQLSHTSLLRCNLLYIDQ